MTSRLGGAFRAREVQRAVRHQAVEQPALLNELDEKRQLPERRHRRAVVPFHMDAPGKSVGRDGASNGRFYYRLFTLRVSPNNPANRSHPSMITTIRPIDVSANLRI